MQCALEFHSADVCLTEEMDGRDVIVYNPCDGWHTGYISSDREGDDCYVGIYDFPGSELYPHTFYIAWALLPDSDLISEQFPRKWG